MFISPYVSLKRITDKATGISIVVNQDEAKDIKRKHGSNVLVKALRKNHHKVNKSGPCVSIPVSDYLKGV